MQLVQKRQQVAALRPGDREHERMWGTWAMLRTGAHAQQQQQQQQTAFERHREVEAEARCESRTGLPSSRLCTSS